MGIKILENGIKINCMESVRKSNLMVTATGANSFMISMRVTGQKNGVSWGPTKVNGKMIGAMVTEF